MPNQWSPKPSINERELRGQTIAGNFGWVRRVDENTYRVHSQRLKREYSVVQTETGWSCDCADSKFRNVRCKHQWAVEISWTLRRKVEQSLVIQTVNVRECVFCHSLNIKKFGTRRNLKGSIQRFICGDCQRTFSQNLGFQRMRASPKVISQSLQPYFSGESLRNVQKFLKLQGVNVSHVAVYSWIQKYVGLMEKYLSQITPQVGDIWRTDELFLKVKGNLKYLFAMMDDETRFWIAQQVSDKKGTSDVRPMFRDAIMRAGKRPKTLISDGAPNFHRAFNREYYTMRNPQSIHVQDIRFGGEIHNNKMERFNGELRDREKVMRGIKKSDTPILKGYQIYHNFIRPHEGLNGATPAERAGIKVEGQNKWLTLIQNASNNVNKGVGTNAKVE